MARCLRVALLAFALLAGGCSTLGYYAHVAHGEFSLLAEREPIARVVDDPNTDQALRARLREAQAARAFASDRLDLPSNRSYTDYVALDRRYVTWSVFAAPEFSVEPVTHCFPFAGCVAYRGYFDEALAEDEARRLATRGNDVAVEGVAAFSTLGWFADPIVSSMLRGDADDLDGTIFHELAHQKVYAAGDTAFNESYASFVEEEGLREWHAACGLPPPDATSRQRGEAFVRLVLDLRERLRGVYARALTPEAMRAAKREEIESFRARYRALRDGGWQGDPRYDGWVSAPIDNARLVPFGLYDAWLPAFAELFRESGSQWPAFHARVRALAGQSASKRDDALAERAGPVR